MAMASANTSRPQLFALESGVMKKPSDDRGPKLRTEMQQAHSTKTAGVRQVKERAAAEAVEVMLISRGRRGDTGRRSELQCTLQQGLHHGCAWQLSDWRGYQSILAPENFTALAHRSVSAATNAAISEVVAMKGAAPRSISRALIFGSLRPALFS